MSAELERLLKVGVKAVRSGNTAAARGLFRALAREYPADLRVWLGLAGSAADRDEQRYALEQVLALDPANVAARNGLARLDAALPPALDLSAATLRPPPAPEPAPFPPAPAPEPMQAPGLPADDGAPAASAGDVIPTTAVAAEPDAGHFPLLNRIALGLIGALALILLAVLFWPRNPAPAQVGGGPPTAILAATAAASPPATAAALPTTAATDPAASQAPAPSATAEPIAVAPTLPAATPTPAILPLGAVLELDGWRATLLRPDYALLLDGAIGELQPEGRFVLALMAVSNGAAEPRTLPADLFTLTDNLQRTYTPLPNASSIYLATYGQEFGDQALEQPFAAQSGMLSIPLIFDVPLDAEGFTLTLRGAGGPGWPITGGDTSGAGP